ncbi:hypothetical protein [Rhodococcus sp. 11-3]|uniref:hypothetical protein n=1 Tax=Rhodococcus sp. 11-3 TaxID=2854796 RepID=UPI00203E09A7|nr:hypothetical protein [Rhodococcus sp. 11-3]USC17050.1 hypothetical protein KZJ41_09360 [Rhodococcus sp. 11-3]
MTLLLALLAATVGGGGVAGLLNWWTGRRTSSSQVSLNAAQREKIATETAVLVMKEVDAEREECRAALRAAVLYIMQIRQDFVDSGLPARPLPDNLIGVLLL